MKRVERASPSTQRRAGESLFAPRSSATRLGEAFLLSNTETQRRKGRRETLRPSRGRDAALHCHITRRVVDIGSIFGCIHHRESKAAAPATRLRARDEDEGGSGGPSERGKSTLFNALSRKSAAAAENYPFCTIEPNIAPIAMPDGGRLERLATMAGSRRAVSATLQLVDVAGLVRGASRGEGLGNKFLATIRKCDVILHVVRKRGLQQSADAKTHRSR